MTERDCKYLLKPTPAVVCAQTGHFGTDEPCLYEEAVRPLEVICTPMGPHYRYDMNYLALSSVKLYHACFGETARMRGASAADALTLSLPVRSVAETTYWRAPLRAPGMPCSLPGVMDVVFGRGQIHFVAIIDLDLLRRFLPPETWEAWERAAAAHLLPASAGSLEALGRRLWHLMQALQTDPTFARYPEAVRSLELDLFEQIASVIELRPSVPVRAGPTRRSQGLRRALAFLHDHGPVGVSFPDLCDAANVSQRTLARAFQDAFDMTAGDYLRLLRLHAVRRALMAARKGETQVTDIACRHGFYELGRFAGLYTRVFGERPSTTLVRQYPEPRACLIQP